MVQRRSDHQLVVAAIGRVVFLDIIEHLHHAEHARLEQRVAIKHDKGSKYEITRTVDLFPCLREGGPLRLMRVCVDFEKGIVEQNAVLGKRKSLETQ